MYRPCEIIRWPLVIIDVKGEPGWVEKGRRCRGPQARSDHLYHVVKQKPIQHRNGIQQLKKYKENKIIKLENPLARLKSASIVFYITL